MIKKLIYFSINYLIYYIIFLFSRTFIIFILYEDYFGFISSHFNIKKATIYEDANTKSIYMSLVHRIGLNKFPELLIGNFNTCSLNISISGTRILFPIDYIYYFDDKEIESILAHELGHYCNKDHIFTILILIFSDALLILSMLYWFLIVPSFFIKIFYWIYRINAEYRADDFSCKYVGDKYLVRVLTSMGERKRSARLIRKKLESNFKSSL